MENNKKLKILVCAYACQPHGSLKWSGPGEMILGWNIVNQIAKHNETFVFTHIDNKSDIEKELAINPIDNLYFYYIDLPTQLKFLLNFEGGLHLYAYLWQIKLGFVANKLHKEKCFDIFHHATFGNDWMASYPGAFLPIPFVRGPGGGAHKTPKTFLSEYSFSNRIWQKIRGLMQFFFRADPVFLIGQKKAKAILVCHNESFDRTPKKFKNKTYLFPVNGISKKDFIALDKKIENKTSDFIILSAGKLFAIKGFALAIKSFKIFSDIVKNAKLIIIGDGPELENLKILSEELKISDRVIFMGWQPREKLLENMLTCDIFLFPSLRDGGGQVVIEAMAAGKPVVCMDIAGPGFHIDKNCGIKIKPEYPDQAVRDIALSLEKLYFNEQLRGNLGARARDKAQTEYNWDNLGNKLQKIYNSITKGH